MHPRLALVAFPALVASVVGVLVLTEVVAERYPPTTRELRGECTRISKLGTGPGGADMTDRMSRFHCDNMIILKHEDDPNRRTIYFQTRMSPGSPEVGFGVDTSPDEKSMQVTTMYVWGDPYFKPTTEGHCDVIYKRRSIVSVTCKARVDEEFKRTVADVTFHETFNW